MEHKGHKRKSKSLKLSKIILNVIFLLPTLYNLVGKIVALASYEAYLARRNLVKIIIIAIMSGIVLASIWLCLLAGCGLYFISIGLSYPLTFLVIILINILILIILSIMIKNAEKNLLFRATRNQIQCAIKKCKDE